MAGDFWITPIDEWGQGKAGKDGTVEIKICGITRIEEAKMLNVAKPDYAGFVVFFEKSRRNNQLHHAWQILRYLDKKIQRVAVTVSPTLEQVKMIEKMDFQILQVHGELKQEVLDSSNLPIWRAWNIDSGPLLEDYNEEPGITGYVLDGAQAGSGKTFDWKKMKDFRRGDKKLILAGGLNRDNVWEAIETLHPDVVDISSGVEGEDGLKCQRKINEFMKQVRDGGSHE